MERKHAPMKLTLVLSSICLLATAANAAERVGDRVKRLVEKFKKLDADGDGKLTREELGSRRAVMDFDADGDGAVTLKELTDGLAARRGRFKITESQKRTLRKEVTVGGLTRTYRLHLPLGHEKKKGPRPLVFAFHGGGGSGASTERKVKLSELADKEGFIVAYPDGIGRNWNDGRANSKTVAHKKKIDDLAFVKVMISEIDKLHKVDPSRIYATGASNGGIFSHYVAANMSDRFAAIAPIIGGIAKAFHPKFRPAQPVSVLIIQGTKDALVPYSGGNIARGGRGQIISTDDAVKTWVSHNGCEAEPVKAKLPDRDPKDKCRVETYTYSKGKNGTSVVLYKIVGGGHTWPGVPPSKPRPENICKDFDAATTIWEFFKKHPKPAPAE
jgi:polyhydroxybutyrate depolymerase